MRNESEPLDPRLAEAISALRDRAPTADLWPGIAPRLTRRRPRGSVLLRWPTALAAGVTIALVSAGGTLLLLRDRSVAVPPAATRNTPALLPTAYTAADSTLGSAIRDLEGALRASLPALDSTTRLGIERSLATLDNAIADAARRRAATPDDPHAERYLTSTLRRKLDVLRTVSTLTARRS